MAGRTRSSEIARGQSYFVYEQMRLARSGLLWMEALADADSPESLRLIAMIRDVEDLADALAKQAEKRARRPAKKRATLKKAM